MTTKRLRTTSRTRLFVKLFFTVLAFTTNDNAKGDDGADSNVIPIFGTAPSPTTNSTLSDATSSSFPSAAPSDNNISSAAPSSSTSSISTSTSTSSSSPSRRPTADIPVIDLDSTSPPFVTNATMFPSEGPTGIPTRNPSESPVAVPTRSPSVAPSRILTVAPTKDPTKSPTTVVLVTPSPTKDPTKSPTKDPTKSPTKVVLMTPSPTSGPTVESSPAPSTVVSNVPSPFVSEPPSSRPTFAPSTTDSAKPTSSSSLTTGAPSSEPPLLITAELSKRFLTFQPLAPMDEIAVKDWEIAHSNFVTMYYERDRPEVTDVKVVTNFLSQDPPYVEDDDDELQPSENDNNDNNDRRSLVVADVLTVYFDQKVEYRVDDPETLTPKDFVKEPFNKVTLRSEYINALQERNSEAFGTVETASNVRIVPDPTAAPSPEEGGDTLVIIIAACGSAGALLIMFLGYVFWRRRRDWTATRYDPDMKTGESPTHNQTGDDNTENQSPKLGVFHSAESLVGFEDKSLATVDYDYSKAFAGDASLSSAGGTLGEFTRGTGATPQSQSRSGRQPSTSLFSTEDSFSDPSNNNNDDGNAPPPYQETLVDVYAPAGKLGVVIDTPNDGAPVVHAIKDSSVIADKLRVGDRLVAVDDEDVRSMTAIKVSKMISRKANNPTRKLSVIRSTLVDQ